MIRIQHHIEGIKEQINSLSAVKRKEWVKDENSV